MNILVILCHPKRGSFNHVIAEKAVAALQSFHHVVTFHDLYEEGFDPVLSSVELERRLSFDEQVIAYTEQLEAAAGLVFCHPDWWCGPPAMLKGWIDRVFRPGIAYEYVGEEFMPKKMSPLLTDKRALVICTTNQDEGKHTRLIESLWIDEVFGSCGIKEAACCVIPGLRELSPAQRRSWLTSVQEMARNRFPADR